jgi:hypothetical protein
VEGPLSDPDIPDGELTRYRGVVGDEEVGGGSHRVECVEEAGRPSYRQLISIALSDGVAYELETLFRRQRGVLVAESYRAETSYHGEPVALEEGRFRGVKILQWGGVIESYPRDITPLLGCALALRGLEFERGARRPLSLWLANTVYWEIETRVERIEQVEVPAGRRRAWRVRARPSFARIAGPLDRLVAMVLPPFVLHFDAEPPHVFLRFEFPTGPFPWNPRGLIEALELPAGRTP